MLSTLRIDEMPEVGQPEVTSLNEVYVDLPVFQIWPKGWYEHARESNQVVVVYDDRHDRVVHTVIFPGDECPK